MTSVGAGSNYLMDAIFEYEVLASSAYNGDWQRLAQIRCAVPAPSLVRPPLTGYL